MSTQKVYYTYTKYYIAVLTDQLGTSVAGSQKRFGLYLTGTRALKEII
jgi:hypothetical protein